MMENKILHCVQNDNLPPTVIASRCCDAISIHKPKADCHVATLLAKTENNLNKTKSRQRWVTVEDPGLEEACGPNGGEVLSS
jgi:hypothetical protein